MKNLRAILGVFLFSIGVSFIIILIVSTSKSFAQITGIGEGDMLSLFGTIITTGITIFAAVYIGKLEESKRQGQEKSLSEKIIKTYLKNELVNNATIACVKQVKERLKANTNMNKIQHGFGSDLEFTEFDRIKIKLLDYNSELFRLTIEVYDFLYMLDKKKDYEEFEINDVNRFIDNYEKLLNAI